MTVFEEHALKMYSDDIATEGIIDAVSSTIQAIGEKLKTLLIKIFIGNPYFTSTDRKVIRDYMFYMNAKKNGVNIFSELVNNAAEIKALTVKFNDAATDSDVAELITKFKAYEKKLDAVWKKYIPADKDLYEVIQVSYTEYNVIVSEMGIHSVPNLEDLLPFIQAVINNTKTRFPVKSKELQSLFDNLFMPYFDMMATLLYHLYCLPVEHDTSDWTTIEEFPKARTPWFMLWDMPIFKAKINGSAFMQNELISYQGRSKYPKGAIFVDESNFHLMPDYFQMFVLYHEYGHSMHYRTNKRLAMTNNEYFSGECLADLFSYAIMGKDLDVCVKSFKKLADVYVKCYDSNRAFMNEQVNIRIAYLAKAIELGRGSTYDDVISLNKMTDVLKGRFK